MTPKPALCVYCRANLPHAAHVSAVEAAKRGIVIQAEIVTRKDDNKCQSSKSQ